MDERTYCLTPEQWRHAKACLTLAKRWGLIGDDSPEALERRRAAKNAQTERAEQDGKPVYGTRRFSAPAYLQYELTRFKLDFAEPCEKIRALGICPDFTDAQTRAWYDANPDLFTRYAGDSFPYEEVKQIIEKRMREEVYDSLSARTYYVDPQTGRDTNDGRCRKNRWPQLFAVNRLALAPGDTVLLKCGSVLKAVLHLRCCGEKTCPITIAALW
mgnify:CR=1 FL=1